MVEKDTTYSSIWNFRKSRMPDEAKLRKDMFAWWKGHCHNDGYKDKGAKEKNDI